MSSARARSQHCNDTTAVLLATVFGTRQRQGLERWATPRNRRSLVDAQEEPKAAMRIRACASHSRTPACILVATRAVDEPHLAGV